MISIVVPFHNERRYLADCVESLLNQSYPPDCYEIIMVDNNSTDNSAVQVEAYSRVKLLSESRPGSYAARNRGIAVPKGDVIALIDGDCAASPDWLQTIASRMQNPEIQMVQGQIGFAHDSFGLRNLAAYEASKATYVFASDNPEIYFGSAGNMAVRRESLRKSRALPGSGEGWRCSFRSTHHSHLYLPERALHSGGSSTASRD